MASVGGRVCGSLLIEILIGILGLNLILNGNSLAVVRAESVVGLKDDIMTDMTPLQKHVSFFDRNKDGLIYPSETYQGFRAIGCSVTLSSVSSILINGILGPKTGPATGKFPSQLFPIYVKNINKAKHGSDSGVYDTEGRFVPAKFEEIFVKHALTNSSGLTSDELMEMLKSNRQPNDQSGWFQSRTEWNILYFLCKDKNGMLSKDTIRSVYDGSLFWKMEKEVASGNSKQL